MASIKFTAGQAPSANHYNRILTHSTCFINIYYCFATNNILRILNFFYLTILLDTELVIIITCKHCLGSQECTQLYSYLVHSEGLIMTQYGRNILPL